jgi:DNA polymerase-3 subunit alpha
MLFERFISPDRPDLPDIDIDFEDERRGEVIRYAQEKYGFDRVANILNFVRYKGANSLNDIGTVYRIPDWKIQAIKDKLVERAEGHPRFADTLVDTFEAYEDVQGIVDETPEIMYATKLEGNYRHTSFHPAAIVIGGTALEDITALYEKQSGKERGSGVAYDKKDSAYLGLLKIDFLSLTTLTGIRATLDALNMSIDDFYRIPLDDPKVYEAFRQCDVLGIFQFEGHTTRRVLKAVAPTKFMDLVDVNALSRPGGDDKAYVKAKNSGEFPELNAAAAQHVTLTHGTIVYQEQIMLILRDYGNFPVADVNAVRKIISDKQDTTILNEYFERFADGGAAHGDSREQAAQIWRNILNATGYAFNIGHAVPYSDIAYRQMWLKVYHPEFYLGQLQKCPDDEEGMDRRRKLIMEAERHGVKVRPPHLLVSKQNWCLDGTDLFAGWTSIKGIGPKMADKIVEWQHDPNIQGELFHDLREGADEVAWDGLLAVPGIGPGRVNTIRQFAESDDPFGVFKTQRTLDGLRQEFNDGVYVGVPSPTHKSTELTENDGLVVFMGVLKTKRFYDTVTQKLKYGPEGTTRESILEELEQPHLLKYVALVCEDEYDEPIRVRVSRKMFPRYRELIDRARTGHDIILAKGYVNDFGGLGVQVSELVVIDPD